MHFKYHLKNFDYTAIYATGKFSEIFSFTEEWTSTIDKATDVSFFKRSRRLLEIGVPFFQDDQLQVKVYWKKTEGSCKTIC